MKSTYDLYIASRRLAAGLIRALEARFPKTGMSIWRLLSMMSSNPNFPLRYVRGLERLGFYDRALEFYERELSKVDPGTEFRRTMLKGAYFRIAARLSCITRAIETTIKTNSLATDPKMAKEDALFVARYGSEGNLQQIVGPWLDSSPTSIIKIVEVIDVRTNPEIFSSIQRFAPPEEYDFQEPYVFEDDDDRPKRTLLTPETWLGVLSDVAIAGGYSVLKDNKLINYEPAAHPENGFVAGLWKYVFGLKEQRTKALIWYDFKKVVSLDSCILISGRCSPNYFHWLIEDLAKFSVVHFAGIDESIPVLIEKSLYPQQMEILKILVGKRPVVFFDHSQLLRVRNLYVPSIGTYHLDRLDIPFWQGSVLSRAQLQFIRSTILKHYGLLDLQLPSPSRKIYLSRRGTRSLLNAAEIEKVFAKNGFEIVFPESLSFEEQVRLFHSARILAGPAGAAFSNLIFCSSGCRVLALVADHNKKFSMQSNLASFANADYTFITGHTNVDPVELSPEELLHSSFYVAPDKIQRALDALKTD